MIRDLDNNRLGQNKVLCSSSEVKLLRVNYYASCPALPAPGRQISGYPPDFGSGTTLTRIPLCHLFLVASFLSLFLCRLFLVASFLLLYLARFLARLVGRPRFYFAGSWIVGLAIGAVEFRGVDVAIGFSGWSL